MGGEDQRGAVRGGRVADAEAWSCAAVLAAMAALADANGVASGLSKEELCAAAGVEDRTYRRARRELLECGAVALVEGGGGRGNTNVWQVRALPDAVAGAATPARRVAAPAGTRPLLATIAAPAMATPQRR